MRCYFCQGDSQVLAIVFLPDGSAQVLSCTACAITRAVWCTKHRKARVGVAPGGTVCMSCIAEEIVSRRSFARRFYCDLMEKLPREQWARMTQWIEDMLGAFEGGRAMILLRGLVIEAHRRNVSVEEVVGDALAKRSADGLVPQAY